MENIHSTYNYTENPTTPAEAGSRWAEERENKSSTLGTGLVDTATAHWTHTALSIEHFACISFFKVPVQNLKIFNEEAQSRIG